MRSAAAKVFVLGLMVASFVQAGSLSARAQVAPPSGTTYPCEAYPTSLTKVNGYIVGKMKVDCVAMQGLIVIFTDITRYSSSGSSVTKYSGETDCQKAYECNATFKFPIADPAGSQRYVFMNEPTSQGTMVSQYYQNTAAYCLPETHQYLHCTSEQAYF